MTTYCQYTGLVTNSDGRQVSLHEGDIWPDDDITVKEHPEQFTTTAPNSEVAGAFPMEANLRDTDSQLGDTVEEKRWEGVHPPGYEKPSERKETEEPDTGDQSTPQERTGLTTGRVERATAAPGERRDVRKPAKSTPSTKGKS
jgi:hypothetical protein